MLISLADYARQHGKAPANARQMVKRESFQTVQKIGRDWLIDSSEEWPDRRVTSGKYKKSKGKDDEQDR